MRENRWSRDWRELHAALETVRHHVPEATSIDLTTTDQSPYGFRLDRVVLPDGRRLDEVDPARQELFEDEVNGRLIDIDWNGVVGEDRTGRARISLGTTTVHAVYADTRPDPDLHVRAITRHVEEAVARYHELQADREIRVRLLTLTVPDNWAGDRLADHVRGLRWHSLDGHGVVVRADSSRPLLLHPRDRLAAIFAVLDQYTATHPEADLGGSGMSTPGSRTVFRARHLRSALHAYDVDVESNTSAVLLATPGATVIDAADVTATPTGAPIFAIVEDLLTDLMHLTHLLDPAAGHTFDTLLDLARQSHEEELTIKEQP